MGVEPGDGLGGAFAERISGDLAQVGSGVKGVHDVNGLWE